MPMLARLHTFALTARWKRMVFASLCWFVLVASLQLLSAYCAWGWAIHQFFWKAFGPPENLYSFRNLLLHRLVLAGMISVPPALLGGIISDRLAVTGRRLFLAWLCWSGSFVLFYFLSAVPPARGIIQALIEAVVGTGAIYEEPSNYLTVLVVVTCRGLPAAFLGILLYHYATCPTTRAGGPQSEPTNRIPK